MSEPPDQAEVESYVRAHRQLGIEISSPGDRRLWELSLKHAWALPYFDAGLAVLDPASVIRHKILVMLAVLEASPRHCDRFIRQDSGILPVIGMCASVLRGVFRVAIGVLALKALRLR